ncbi:bacterial regulatory s, luxR family protein [Clostridium argentinense CDC 2741]|uniref:Stage 0 sporulation protein A homolog n=1 Tax=Clostridium argentinense CDC 2741 TaxID=1418104 RepID=A0A0C1ULR0_9CLOT|nr:response regulator transcription factor [Clostridium argentinense]ARC85169.1 DNA-binding response regulator [Clostridium argentinense]KIE48175.1 bacterial regulatory s, luxR family protein [Clostridium argentinense CDC 2741]NFF39528.1 response regulator transcription factor [Clostridium argentinense]NFP50925.1 response regulator transcription factor [Clostridium argentinense]NFP72715.1 response regulator transcription factor [Clostridium argentinense]
MSVKILIADDDELIRESLKIILNMDKNFSVVATASNGLEAVKACLKADIDVALLDVRMPVMNGVEALKEIVSKCSTKTLILTTFDEDEYIKDALKHGAMGYLLKNNSPEKIKNAIYTVVNGNIVLQDTIINKIISHDKENQVNFTKNNKFTEREKEIIKLISEGLSNKEIALNLYISEGTVKNYISSILDKTCLNHRTQIAIYYLKGLL